MVYEVEDGFWWIRFVSCMVVVGRLTRECAGLLVTPTNLSVLVLLSFFEAIQRTELSYAT